MRNRNNNMRTLNSMESQNIKRARSFETNQRSSINQADSTIGTRRSIHQNVFFNLFKIAKERQEKSADSYRQALEKLAKKEAEECTFKPDFSKTHLKTKRYLERRGVSSKNDYKTAEQSNCSNPESKRSNNLLKNGKNQQVVMNRKKVDATKIVIPNAN